MYPFKFLTKFFFVLEPLIIKSYNLDCLTMSWENKEVIVVIVTQVWEKFKSSHGGYKEHFRKVGGQAIKKIKNK